MFVSDIAVIIVTAGVLPGAGGGKIEATCKRCGFCESAVAGVSPPITNWDVDR
jgi:hypothetical protein